jgi:thiamine-phosphate pyrophosphorylase
VIGEALAGLTGSGLLPDEVAVQLRDKDLGGRALTDLARALRAVTAEAGVALYVNDRVDVALAVGADGVHLAGASLPPAAVRAVAPRLALAVSAHAPSDLVGLAGVVRFGVLGPIRDTPSKRAYGPPLGLGALRAARASGVALLAIGGLGPADVPEVIAAGAHGVACIRAVLSAADPGLALRTLGQALAAAPVTPPDRT